MDRGAANNKVVVILILVAVSGGLLLYWEILAGRKEGDFAEALRNGEVRGLPIGVRDKVWTERELSEVRAMKLDSSAGPQRSLERTIHTRGGYTLSSMMYSYQATITDSDTGIKYMFGYRRREPMGWVCEGVHPDSAQKHVEQRMEMLDPQQYQPGREFNVQGG